MQERLQWGTECLTALGACGQLQPTPHLRTIDLTAGARRVCAPSLLSQIIGRVFKNFFI